MTFVTVMYAHNDLCVFCVRVCVCVYICNEDDVRIVKHRDETLESFATLAMGKALEKPSTLKSFSSKLSAMRIIINWCAVLVVGFDYSCHCFGALP